MKTCVKPLRTFRIYPEYGSALHYRVHIFKTVADLRLDGRIRFNSPSRKALGWCGSAVVVAFPKGNKKGYVRPICGDILLAHRHLTVGIISHECTHAALAYARRRKFDPTDESVGKEVSGAEERLCRVQGELTRQLVAQLFKHRFLVESARSDGRR